MPRRQTIPSGEPAAAHRGPHFTEDCTSSQQPSPWDHSVAGSTPIGGLGASIVVRAQRSRHSIASRVLRSEALRCATDSASAWHRGLSKSDLRVPGSAEDRRTMNSDFDPSAALRATAAWLSRKRLLRIHDVGQVKATRRRDIFWGKACLSSESASICRGFEPRAESHKCSSHLTHALPSAFEVGSNDLVWIVRHRCLALDRCWTRETRRRSAWGAGLHRPADARRCRTQSSDSGPMSRVAPAQQPCIARVRA